jgi:hypothetical protein
MLGGVPVDRRAGREERDPTALVTQQPELPLLAAPKSRSSGVLGPAASAKLAIARRAKPGTPLGHVRLVLTLELRRTLGEQLSDQAIRTGKNLEAVVIELLGAGAKR